jgi:hypothetical protein
METIKKRLSKNLGYNVTDQEIISLYRDGNLNLTDKEENEIIKYLND